MEKVTITEIIDDLRVADEITRRYERRYWLSSEDFYKLYKQGLLDDGEHTDEFSEWSAFYQVKVDREEVLKELSSERVIHLQEVQKTEFIEIASYEPAYSLPVGA